MKKLKHKYVNMTADLMEVMTNDSWKLLVIDHDKRKASQRKPKQMFIQKGFQDQWEEVK